MKKKRRRKNLKRIRIMMSSPLLPKRMRKAEF